jgi:hypothetical protein
MKTMKYAFIVLIAVYLVAYGCSPDKSDENSTGHEKSATTSVEQQHQEPAAEVEAVVPEAAEQVEETAQTVVEEQKITEPAPINETTENESAEQPEEVAATPTNTDEQQATTLPCGRTVTDEDTAKQTPPPCAQALARTSGTADEQPAPDVSAALQEMVDATNDMVMVTRQLVIATQAMIDATQNAAPETAEEQPQE